MDVLLSVRKTCCCCGAQSMQPIYADTAAFAEGSAALDGATTDGRLNRGMQVCMGCGHAAPSLDAVPHGMTPAQVQAAQAGMPYQQALRQRSARSVHGETATRWLAYASAFEGALSPEQAGLAWVNAAAELEKTRLTGLGSAEKDSQPDPDQAHAARRKAIGYLSRVFEAEFGPASGATALPGVRRALRRWRLGEPAYRPARWSAVGHSVTDTSRDVRFEVACTLTDLLRRTGEFVAARTVALRALHTGQTPDHLASILSFQLRLCHLSATDLYRHRDLVDTVVAFPMTTGSEPAVAHQDGLSAAA